MFDLAGVGALDILPFIAIGFAAQLIDGALGMAFGQISSTLLISMGVPPAAASAGVHTAETFTTAVSGVRHRHTERRPRIVEPLGVVGGFLDAAGGGGWGAIVTSNLLVQGSNPRKTIGTVNTAEFFLTVTISATFLAALGWEAFTIATTGLLIGGVLAAPFGAIIAKRVNPDTLLTFVGALVTATSSYALYRALA